MKHAATLAVSRDATRQAGTLHRVNPLDRCKSKIQNPKSKIAAFILLALAAPAFPDSITFTGSSIALPNCTIEALRGGQVLYRDPSGTRQRRPLEEIRALSFADLPQLDQAEAAIAKEDPDGGLQNLLEAMLAAKTDLQKLWVHARLARLHDARGEYVPAAGHAAAVAALSDDPYWRVLEPVSPPAQNEPAYSAAKEAFDHLQRAAKIVKASELKAALARMLAHVQPVHDRLAKSYAGPPIEPGSTVSGIAKEKILAREPDAIAPAAGDATRQAGSGATREAGAPAPGAAPAPAEPQRVQPATPAAPSPPALPANPSGDGPRDPDGIDPLIGKRDWKAALERCEAVSRSPDRVAKRDIPHFLYQYGLVLARSGRARDAAIQFTRCAVLYPESADAVHSLIETAVIYRDEFRKRETALRLLDRAIAEAEAHGDQAAAALAKELRASSS